LYATVSQLPATASVHTGGTHVSGGVITFVFAVAVVIVLARRRAEREARSSCAHGEVERCGRAPAGPQASAGKSVGR
jgi:hypothetical protein